MPLQRHPPVPSQDVTPDMVLGSEHHALTIESSHGSKQAHASKVASCIAVSQREQRHP